MSSDTRSDDEARQRLLEERDRLEGMRTDLAQGLSGETESESVGELSDVDQHPADEGTETFNRERDLGLLDSVTGELDDIDAALRRLDDGTYGVCTACGKPIGAERLEALPATPFCIDDARLAEVEAARGGSQLEG